MSETQRDRLFDAIRVWMADLEAYPGWKEWRRQRFAHTLHFDNLWPEQSEVPGHDFKFSSEIENQHAVVIQYLGLAQTIDALKECEFYFRRFPFHGMPVSHYNHVTNICEMYFGRFYEFKERLKQYFDAVDAATPAHNLIVGAFIKQFGQVFDQELRKRNQIHHERRFEEIGIDRLLLTGSLASNPEDRGWKREHMIAYRMVTSQWAQRVRRRGAQMDQFLEATARATLESCSFLSERARGPVSS